MKIAYVTWDGPDDDRELLLTEWERAGIDGSAVRWDDPGADWSGFDAAVVRSPWNYVDHRQEFVGWVRRASAVTRLLNPPAVLERNTDKTYLREFAELGIPIVPTHWVGPGDAVSLPQWDDYVVKPTVSAGARGAIRTADVSEAALHAKKLVAEGKVAMVQPYLDMVEAEGETSLLYFGGEFSHALRRDAMLADGTAPPRSNHVRAELRDPAPDQFELAERVLGMIPEPLLYARVDLVRLPGGTPALIELELTEPYLYLAAAPGTATRLTTALLALL
ncbi:ATP-grasp domain-containing protein [Sphaerisporangium corydalis]|uniref:RimK family alpha-L-glutamate ligase n=1 Tax=Sphaerisporangium corydalis TaxID=1441875 RepID=A0ABV9E6H9_9ACTN|nr:hypothetical protein [Sphaerisporangium corydalis]